MDPKTAIQQVTDSLQAYFSDRLAAAYLTGSFSTGEAVLGESDLDYWGFVCDELSKADQRWIQDTASAVDKRFDIFGGVHINIMTVENITHNKLARFMLQYNSILCCGRDILSEISARKPDSYIPDKHVAKLRLPFARQCFEDALRGKCPRCIDEVPANSYLAARKFARYFVIVEGAYFLMSVNKFESFRQENVIALLKEKLAGFDDILDLSLSVSQTPFTARITHDDFLTKIRPLVYRFFKEIENS